jgi:hypothetical protein
MKQTTKKLFLGLYQESRKIQIYKKGIMFVVTIGMGLALSGCFSCLNNGSLLSCPGGL